MLQWFCPSFAVHSIIWVFRSVKKIWICAFCLSGPPGPPTGPLRTVDVDKTSVTLAWKPPKDDGGSPLTEYIFERRESSRTSWTKVASVPPDTLEYEATNLNETINYYFRVSAKNKHGVSSPLETESTVRPKSKFGECGMVCSKEEKLCFWSLQISRSRSCMKSSSFDV